MTGNICPKCGKGVMTYSRFFREAEPYKISKCGHCGSDLCRNKSVYLLLLVMCLFLLATIYGVFWIFRANMVSAVPAIALGAAAFAGWTLLTNYLGFALIGWRSADDK